MSTPYDKKETIPVKHVFTEEELAKLAREQGLLYQERELLEDNRKQIAKDFSARIDGVDSKLREISNKTSSGFEMRPTECGVVLMANIKMKEYFSLLTGQMVEQRRMEAADFQLAMAFDSEQNNQSTTNDIRD